MLRTMARAFAITAVWVSLQASMVTALGSNNSTSAAAAAAAAARLDARVRAYHLAPSLLAAPPRPPGCPECPEPTCFNCLLPAFSCSQYGECREFDGTCDCPTGFGGVDCLSPLCGSPARGQQRFPRPDGQSCECDENWSGINCNLCRADNACSDILLGGDRLGENGTCYTGGQTIRRSYQECAVTNERITALLPGRPPRVTFSCDKADEQCNFQFWIGGAESFYCGLGQCRERTNPATNLTEYECQTAECSCVPGRMLCGENGSVDIGDFLSEEIKGPATMACSTTTNPKTGIPERNCRFLEPAMNQLISDIFGDPAIFLTCDSGECVHYSEVPGFQAPAPPPRSIFWLMFSAGGAVVFVVLISGVVYFLGSADKFDAASAAVRLPAEESARLMAEHVPTAIQFHHIGYDLGPRTILDGVSGSVQPGELLAIIGQSGSGKSTVLDILARRNKRGYARGQVLVNGRQVSDREFKHVTGYVDQEETLMPTLTVYETVLYSAILRLPRIMSLDAKKFRTLETLEELGILGIKDSYIGHQGFRGISGGEKRRVSIACELVTSPSVLMLDEPTSGLDGYNALSVVESLSSLAKTYKRTVIFTIHQPRSNIISQFDKLLLLAAGRTVYSGPFDQCVDYFASLGHLCPRGYNVADYLIDLTALKSSQTESVRQDASLSPQVHSSDLTPPTSDDQPARPPSESGAASLRTLPPVAVEDSPRAGAMVSALNASALSLFSGSSRWLLWNQARAQVPLPDALAKLVSQWSASDLNHRLDEEFEQTESSASTAAHDEESAPNSNLPSAPLTGFKKAALWTQFTVLSARAFKNLYRNPMLMLSHYIMAVVLAGFCSVLYHGLTLDISGFQNRLGLFFFVLALLGFSTLTSLSLFASERALYIKERSNGYYSPVTYFTAKLLFDILPLRVIPPFILGAIVYPVGLIPEVTAFWKFVFVLVLFSLAASSLVLFISLSIKDPAVANLVGSLSMLFSLLFAGLLINRDRIPAGLKWLQHLSFFHAAYEALIVNELRKLSLKEHKYGIDIDVPAASIISSFGFNAQAFWWPDVGTLVIQFAGFTALSLLWLTLFVKERK